MWDTKNCDAFKTAVDRSLTALAKYADNGTWDAKDLCRNYQLTDVRIHPLSDGDSWYDPANGYRVAGLTYYQGNTIYLANEDWHSNALTHELAHLYECRWDACHTTASHPQWEERGIYKAESAAW
jgi:hypothetical protein